ncbi:MAG: hypothetical protein LBQ43_04615, partial [Holosporales bacterium]|nr:hypothetical protein [Holosporales bacterium]
AAGSGQRAAGSGQRAAGSGQRAAGSGQRAAGSGACNVLPAWRRVVFSARRGLFSTPSSPVVVMISVQNKGYEGLPVVAQTAPAACLPCVRYRSTVLGRQT